MGMLLAAMVVVAAASTDGLADYLMDETLEIALARSAAPDSVGASATVWVLRPSGYEKAVEGDNGFHCMVLRSFGGPRPTFDLRTRAPICLNPAASESVLPAKVMASRELAAGASLEQIDARIQAAADSGEISAPAPGAFGYMLSGAQYLNPRVGSWRPHLMFYAPELRNADAGGVPGIVPGVPVVIDGSRVWPNITVPLDYASFVTARTLDRSVLDSPGRFDIDRQQDAGRKALDVYEWLGITPGMSVADVFAGGGYNSHLLSLALGEQGRVHAVLGELTPIVKERFGADFVALVNGRIESAGLRNVTVYDRLADLADGSLDAVVSVRNYHDVEFFGFDPATALGHVHRALRPGGVVGVVEVATHHPGWHDETHRLNARQVIDDFEAAGFVLIGRSELLANPEDDHSATGFDAGRHTVDRYLLKFRRVG